MRCAQHKGHRGPQRPAHPKEPPAAGDVTLPRPGARGGVSGGGGGSERSGGGGSVGGPAVGCGGGLRLLPALNSC